MAATLQDIKTPPAEKSSDSGRLIKQLQAVVGNSYVLTTPESTRQYRIRFPVRQRSGAGGRAAKEPCRTVESAQCVCGGQ
jgi:hypothetical protein